MLFRIWLKVFSFHRDDSLQRIFLSKCDRGSLNCRLEVSGRDKRLVLFIANLLTEVGLE